MRIKGDDKRRQRGTFNGRVTAHTEIPSRVLGRSSLNSGTSSLRHAPSIRQNAGRQERRDSPAGRNERRDTAGHDQVAYRNAMSSRLQRCRVGNLRLFTKNSEKILRKGPLGFFHENAVGFDQATTSPFPTMACFSRSRTRWKSCRRSYSPQCGVRPAVGSFLCPQP